MVYREISECRAGGGEIIPLLNLGNICLSGFVKPGEPDPPTAPLELVMGRRSGLVQLRHTVEPERMFRRYWYESGRNEKMVAHLRGIVKAVQERVDLRRGDVVVDIGCNDGTMLAAYPHWVRRWGFDPSDIHPPDGVADVFVNDFFDRSLYTDKKARVITSIAMFYDIDDPVAFAKQVADMLADDGVWVIEMHYLMIMALKNGFDAICHEHLTYYYLSSLRYVLLQAGLEVWHVETNDINGGSFRLFIGHQGRRAISSNVERMVLIEWRRSIDKLMAWQQDIDAIGQTMRDLLANLKADGKLVLGYGASTKGNTILQCFGIGPELLPAIAERNPAKYGLETAGTRIPIISEAEARAMQPDYFLALPYHLLDAFMRRESEFAARGGQWIVPVPSPKVVASQVQERIAK